MLGSITSRGLACIAAATCAFSALAFAADPATAPAKAETPAQQTAAAPAQPAPKEWADEIKNPCKEFSWGMDVRYRREYTENAIGPALFNNNGAGNVFNYDRYRVRGWASIKPAGDDLSFNARTTWEGRYYWAPDNLDGFSSSYGIVDNLNVQIKNLANTKSVGTAGLQDVVLLDGWLVLDGTPLDGSRTIFFNGGRFQYDLPHSAFSLDVAVLQTRANADDWITIGNDDNYHAPGEARLSEQNEFGGFLDLRYAPSKADQADAYFIVKDNDKVAANGDDGTVMAIGGRYRHAFSDKLSARVEGTYEFGDSTNNYTPSTGNIQAWGITSKGTYEFKDQWKDQLSFVGEALSGDDPNTKTNEQFDPLWGRWPQFSELYVLTMANETRIAQVTNLYRIGPMWDANPTDKLSLSAAAYTLWAGEITKTNASITGDSHYRGELLEAMVRYKFNRFLAGHLWAEYMLPGNYYSGSDAAMFLRAELTFTF